MKFVKSISTLYWLLYCRVFDFLNFTFSKLDLERQQLSEKELVLYNYYTSKNVRDFYYTSLYKNNFVFIDLLYSLFESRKYKLYNNINLFRAYFRVLQTNQGFYFNFKTLHNKSIFLSTLKNIFLSGLKYIWLGLRYWFLGLVVGLSIIYYSMVIRCLPFSKTVFVWILVAMFAYWLLSGFVFFVKKYQFGKYTTAIQRFWRRSYILFWLIELFLFAIFIYLTLNANTESYYMFDQIQIFKTHLYSWRAFLFKLFPVTLLMIIGYLFLLTVKWNVLSKHTVWLVVITGLLTYVVWVEFYQFFHVCSYYGNFNWTYDIDEKIWILELEPRKTRTANHYVMLMIMLRFWHIVLIFAFWVFFVLRSMEVGRVRYPLLSANLQNFLLLYLFVWVMMYPWLKFLFRRYMDMPYYWFYVNNRRLGYRVFFNDLSLIYYGIIDSIKFSYYNALEGVFNTSFFYWTLSNGDNFFSSYRKSVIKNLIVHTLSN